ncbi:MAG: hypothetical protein O2892_19250 [Actinomycetota bacterium]|nr:hypothetical protein [Actinomycetota bacterium]MDA2951141.1 hypothetical protein [Actinomycetota bacterium]
MTDLYKFRAPEHTLILTPGEGQPNFTYGRTPTEEDFVGFEFTDLRAGPCMFALSAEAVPVVIEGLQRVLDNIEHMRAAYDRANGIGGDQ